MVYFPTSKTPSTSPPAPAAGPREAWRRVLPHRPGAGLGQPATPDRAPRPANGTGGGRDTRAQPRVEVISYGRLTWVNIERPTPLEIDWLRTHYPFFHPLDLDDCLSKIQRPKIDEYDDYLFIVLHFPVYNKAAQVTMASEVDIFVGANYVITLHNGDLRPLSKFFKECQSDETCCRENMGRSSGFLLYKLIDRLVDYCFPILNKIGSNIDDAEDRIFGDGIREVIRDLSLVRRDVIAFRRIIRPQISIIGSLEHKERPFLREDLDVYWGNISDHVNKIWDILEDHRDVIEGLMATSESINSLRMNEVMKVLTLISTIMLPMAVISGIYGMNISVLPFAHTEFSFLITVGTMIAVLVSMLTYFRVRHWI